MTDRVDAGTGRPSLPGATAEHLRELGVVPDMQALVAAASAVRSITSHVVRGDYVAISPGAGGHIAGYVSQRRLSLALPPGRADAVGAKQGWAVWPDSGITSYVQIPAIALASEAQRVVALSLLLESLDWRALGPHWLAGAGSGDAAAGSPVEMCPVHFTEMLGGHCEQCDD